jgi:outer membrane lipoprotein-sorting protein
MIAYTLTLCAALLTARSGEAELLLHQMDETIRAAKTLRIEFEITGTEHESWFPLRGSLVLADRNRYRFEWRTTGGPEDLTVGDGERIGTRGLLKFRGPEFRPQPDWHNEVLRSWLGRGGTVMSALVMEVLKTADGRVPGPGVGPCTSKARLLPDEEVNGVKARVVEYDLTWPRLLPADPSKPIKVRVWIDPKTKLPIRRSMADGTHRFTATHTKFELNPKLDDVLFVLPK